MISQPPFPLTEWHNQQPAWVDPDQLDRVRETLAARRGLVDQAEVSTLRDRLALAAAGKVTIVQAGDCAEDPADCGRDVVARKIAALDQLADTMAAVAGRPVLRVGRIAGQFAKPRSRLTEFVEGAELPVYRGHLVNGPQPTVDQRRPDALRLITGYLAARDIARHLLALRPAWRRDRIWTSHEALLLDYEQPLVRTGPDGRAWLASTHWPWIGERTRQLDGAHVALLATVMNPVSVKVGPETTADELAGLCERLDPGREPGRLSFIVRMGPEVVAQRLPALVAFVRAAGHPALWLSDPMHANTVVAPSGHKTRYVRTLCREVHHFHQAVSAAGGIAAGVHLETTPDEVTECVFDECDADRAGRVYTSLCDPRLTVDQAVDVLTAWHQDPDERQLALASEAGSPRHDRRQA